MTQIERIIQGLMIAQEFDPYAKIVGDNGMIFIKASVAIGNVDRLNWLGWLHLPNTGNTMLMYYTDKS